MALVVNLADIVGELEMANNETTVFLHIRTGQFVYLSEYADSEEREALAEKIETNDEEYVCLPSAYEIHEYRLMEAFVEQVEDVSAREQLYCAIRGRGAFRRFKDAVNELGIREAWFAFKTAALRDIAVAWCREHHIAFAE